MQNSSWGPGGRPLRVAASFNKYFYRYQPPRPASELLAEFWALEKEAEGMLQRVGGK